jgi:hypothetical protein
LSIAAGKKKRWVGFGFFGFFIEVLRPEKLELLGGPEAGPFL